MEEIAKKLREDILVALEKAFNAGKEKKLVQYEVLKMITEVLQNALKGQIETIKRIYNL